MPAAPRIPSLYYERLFAVMFPDYLGDINVRQEFSGKLDAERLQQAFLTALAVDPMWSYRFVTSWWTPYWQPIAREERVQLFRVLDYTDASTRMEAIEQLLRTPLHAAIELLLLRTPQNDLIWYRGDHRLADAGAVRFFVEAVTEGYQRELTPPETDGPLVRRTIGDIQQFSLEERRKFLKELLQYHRHKAKVRAYKVVAPTPAAPFVMPQILCYSDGSNEALAARALQDRTTPVYVIGSIVYSALREMVSLSKTAPVPINFAVDLRRYLPAESRRATASMFVGDVTAFVAPSESADLSSVITQIRTQILGQRGRYFGVFASPLAVELPLIGKMLQWYPYAIMRWRMRRTLMNWAGTPSVMVTDLGSYGQPGADWGGVQLQSGYCSQGKMECPAIMIGYSTFGSRFTLSVGCSTKEFITELTTRIDAILSQYLNCPPLLTSNQTSGTPG